MQGLTSLLAKMLDAHELMVEAVPAADVARRILQIFMDETQFYYGAVVIFEGVEGSPRLVRSLALVGSSWNKATGGFFPSAEPSLEVVLSGRSLVALVVRRGCSVLTGPPAAPGVRLPEPSPTALIGMPLRRGGELFGVLCLAGRPEAEPAALLTHLDGCGRAAARIISARLTPEAPSGEILEALTRSEAILATMPDAVIAIGMEGLIRSLNAAATRIFGYPEEALLGKHIASLLVDQGSAAQVEMHTGDAQFFGTEHNLTGCRANGSTFPMEVTIARGRYDQRPIFIWIVRDVTKLRQAELERERFFNLTPEMLAIANFEGYFTRLNPAWSRTLGYSTEELLARPYLDFVHPDDRPKTVGEAVHILQDNMTEHFENRYRCKDGSYRWLQWVAVGQQKEGLIYAAARDVTEQRRLRSKIATQNVHLEHYSAGLKRLHRLNTARHGDLTALIQDHLQVGLEFLGMTTGLLARVDGGVLTLLAGAGDTREIRFRAAPMPLDQSEIALVVERQCTLAWPMASASERVGAQIGPDLRGRFEAYIAAPVRVRGELFGVLGFSSVVAREEPIQSFEIDIFELMVEGLGRFIASAQAEDARQLAARERERLVAVLELSPDVVAMFRPDGELFFLNRAGRALWAIDEGSPLFGRRFDELLDEGSVHPLRAIVLPAAQRRGAWVGEVTMRSAAGERIPMSQLLVAHTEANGELSHFSTVCRDIRALKEVDRLKNEFVSTVSHELRTPLTSLRGSLGLLVAGVLGELPPRVHELLLIAQNNTERLIRLINDILDLEKIESGRMTFEMGEVALDEIVASTLRGLVGSAAQAGVTLHAELPPEGVVVYGDADRLTQVLVNLLGNAIKFSPAGGVVTVRAGLAGPTSARVEVVDQGPGIPAEARSRIFGRFQQLDSTDARKKGGTGLGLAISKAIVLGHGGHVGVESEEGRGSVFYFTVPTPTSPDPGQVASEAQGEVVLIVEDDVDLTRVLQRILQDAGWSTSVAFSLQEARQRLLQSTPRVILLDMRLPDGIGTSLLNDLGSLPGLVSVPIIVLSSSEPMEPLQPQVQQWIMKPFESSELLDALRQTVEEPSA